MYKSLSKNYKIYKILPKELLFSVNFISVKSNNTAEDLGRLITCSADTALRILENGLSNKDDLILVSNYALKEKKNIYLAVDGLIIKKYFSEKIEGTSYLYNYTDQTYGKCIHPIVFALICGDLSFPVHFSLFESKNISNDEYKSKNEITRDALELLKIKLPSIDNILADAGFCSNENISFINNLNMKFDIKIPKNRGISLIPNGKKFQVQVLFDNNSQNNLLNKNKRSKKRTKNNKKVKNIFKNKIIKGFINDIPIAIIRSYRNAKPFYIITNYNLKDINTHLKAYSRRWKIETIFRTCKQYLGLSDCQCLSKDKQKNYISFVFLTYSLIQILRKKKRLKNPEALINRLKFKNFKYIFEELYSVYQLVHQS